MADLLGDALHTVSVASDTPLPFAPSYSSREPLLPGCLVRVPLGSRQVAGVVLSCLDSPSDQSNLKLKPIAEVLECLPPLAPAWLRLLQFAADYYQRPVGDLLSAALPRALLDAQADAVARALDKLADPRYQTSALGNLELLRNVPARFTALHQLALRFTEGAVATSEARALHKDAARIIANWLTAGWLEPVSRIQALTTTTPGPALHAQQVSAVQAIEAKLGSFAPFLLWGATGSGKTEVYLHACAQALAANPAAQVLVMVPEINLTPQLEAQFRGRFIGATVVSLHSGLADGERLRHWLQGHLGEARIVLGTRMAVFASLPRLALIIVDEEHDASYKAQDGARYSARDLAVWRARSEGVPVVLGSATPSLDSWQAALSGKYTRLDMPGRVAERWPVIRLADSRGVKFDQPLTEQVCSAIDERVARGEQTLIFLNRRGYAPVVACTQCDWVSNCTHCSAFQVFHKSDRTLRCHHCASTRRVPRSCPNCGNLDLRPLGQGTQRLEEWLTERFAPARIARIDADTTRRKGSAASAFADVHAGAVDILVGTQMVTKGHDFQRVSLVVAANVDGALYSADFRASERIFAQLMQAAGRAGRSGLASEVLIQTQFPKHPLFAALIKHDYAAFASSTLAEREAAAMPPFSHLALCRAEAKTQEAAQEFLGQARSIAAEFSSEYGVTLYSPVPASLQRVADTERAQMLLESARRPALQAFLSRWISELRSVRSRVRWAVDVDPTDI